MEHDIEVDEGSPYYERIVIFRTPENEPSDMDNWEFSLSIRRGRSAPPVLTCTPENGKLIVHPTLGSVALKFTQEDIDLLGFSPWLYDLRLQRPFANTDFPVYGRFRFIPRITRS
jgi:hypothetical protein